MIRSMKTLLLALLPLVLLAAAACGGGDSDERLLLALEDEGASLAFATASRPRETVITEVEVVREVVVEKEVVKAVAVEPEMLVLVDREAIRDDQVEEFQTDGIESVEEEAALVSQERIIVRTVEMELEVADVSGSIDSISDLAQDLGGWVVSSDRSERHHGFISVRVPAERLEDAVLQLRALAEDVESEISTSRDVTDQYVDIGARLKNQEATEEALLKLLERAEKVEDALEVQNQLTKVQEQIERLQGRIKFLEQTSAFSLIHVALRLAPIEMLVDGGLDLTSSVGQATKFRATFRPPEGIEDFVVTWDFGDGSRPVITNRTAPTADPDVRRTATVTHVYDDDKESPYFAIVEIRGTGDSGVAEGEDTLTVSVTRLPTIEVFAGESRIADERAELEFAGTFTRPEGLADLTFKWEFGDGTAPATGSVGEGTRATGTHVYSDHRPQAYTATLTVVGQSPAGEVEASDSIKIFVTESVGWTLSGWSPGDTWKTAVRALSGVGQGLAMFFMWLGIFSPVWIVGGLVGVAIWRRRRASSAGGPTPD